MHEQGTKVSTRLHYYGVPISHVSLTDAPGLTTVINRVENGIEFAVSFDFTPEAAAALLARAPDELIAKLRQMVSDAPVDARTVQFEAPLLVSLACTPA